MWAVSEAARILGDLEHSAGSFPDLVQLILEGVDLPSHLLEEQAFWRDEQAAVLAPGYSAAGQSSHPPGCLECRA